MATDSSSPRPDPHIDTDDLFGKLDQLISRHQGRAATHGQPATVPTLTEAVEARAPPTEPQIPVLDDVVELRSAATGAALSASTEQRRQLQIALYLQLRQRLDQELGGEAFAFLPPAQRDALLQALRNALPAAIRESVEQVLGRDAEG
jgi:hypothetical protein